MKAKYLEKSEFEYTEMKFMFQYIFIGPKSKSDTSKCCYFLFYCVTQTICYRLSLSLKLSNFKAFPKTTQPNPENSLSNIDLLHVRCRNLFTFESSDYK